MSSSTGAGDDGARDAGVTLAFVAVMLPMITDETDSVEN